MSEHNYLIHTDGGSRGNPGPAAAGFTIEGEDISRAEHGEYLGERTNNYAEYTAVTLALKKLKALIGAEKSKESIVRVHADSELLVKQLNGEYKVKEETIRDLFLDIWNLRLDFKKVMFSHIPREQNTKADKMVNYALDREADRLL